MVTRAEIQAALDEIQKGLASTGYSIALRGSKEQMAAVLRDRLTEGDIRPGDQIKITVLGETSLSGVYDVSPARTILLPGGMEVSVRGVLRSEIQDYLTTQFKKYVVDPTVTAMPCVRLQIFGAIGSPGFFCAPAGMLLSRVIQDNGHGPANNAQFKKSQIRRNGQVVVDGSEFQDAIFKGRTLDQLNVQAGDEIVVAARPSESWIWRIVAGLSALAGLIYVAARVI
jgi:protein involved in polysaccharide export with SLBB domain